MSRVLKRARQGSEEEVSADDEVKDTPPQLSLYKQLWFTACATANFYLLEMAYDAYQLSKQAVTNEQWDLMAKIPHIFFLHLASCEHPIYRDLEKYLCKTNSYCHVGTGETSAQAFFRHGLSAKVNIHKVAMHPNYWSDMDKAMDPYADCEAYPQHHEVFVSDFYSPGIGFEEYCPRYNDEGDIHPYLHPEVARVVNTEGIDLDKLKFNFIVSANDMEEFIFEVNEKRETRKLEPLCAGKTYNRILRRLAKSHDPCSLMAFVASFLTRTTVPAERHVFSPFSLYRSWKESSR